jgi:hypothetical protein
LAAALFLPLAVFGAEPTPAEKEGQTLAAELRAQRPVENLSTSGLLKQRDASGKWRRQTAVRMEVRLGEKSWQSVYQALTTNGLVLETLLVTHRDGQPNRYQYLRAAGSDDALARAVTLTGDQAAVPFAGSDFWLADLGLEFFHWPLQRIVKKEMRKSRSCRVLESIQANPGPGGYARVLSWIDFETDKLVRAEAYDQQRRLLKEFSIGSVKKINGRWQLKSMEIRDEATDSRTRLEFDLRLEADR